VGGWRGNGETKLPGSGGKPKKTGKEVEQQGLISWIEAVKKRTLKTSLTGACEKKTGRWP